MGRDIMLAINAILGPTCIAFGYYKNMTGKSNALGEYLSGWFESYLRLMIRGIVTAVLVTAIALYSYDYYVLYFCFYDNEHTKIFSIFI